MHMVIAAAVYEYQADCDGEWGEISFDFEQGTAEIVRLAEWDTVRSNVFAKRVTAHVLSPNFGREIKTYLLVFTENS